MKKLILSSLLIFAANAEDKISFNEQVRPILSEKCYYCHGPDAEDIKGKLQLHTFDHVTKERTYTRKGKTRTLEAAIIPGDPENSLLFQRVITDDEDDIMPPVKRHMAVTKKEIEVLRQWIQEGAEYEELWSFKPLPKKVALPERNSNSAKNAIDLFIQQKLQKNNLQAAADADENILLRRLYLTLTGLIPTPAQIAEFKNDKSGQAYENTVDKLLKSKACAEHLAVEWMDVARYADSYGYQTDRGRHVWPYRDWILRAFDKNLPYDQFIHQQLAGDMLPDSNDETKLATAFNRMHMQKNEGGSTPEEFRTEYVADRAQTAATAFLGMTMECCRCHDHKYDPMSQEDYFKTFALFNNVDEAGLYSFFTQAVPSPSMPVFKNNEKEVLANKAKVLSEKQNNFDNLHVSLKNDFEQWKESWNKDTEVKGLVAQFTFDKIESNKIISEDGKKNGTYNAAYSKPIDGKFGKGFLLDGDSALDFKGLGNIERHKPFSLSLWVNAVKKFERSNILGRNRGWYDAGSRGYELMIEDGKLSFALVHFYPGNEIRVRTQKELPINAWHQVSVSYDGSSKAGGIKLFLDGEELVCDIIKDKLTKEIWYQNPDQKPDPKKKKKNGDRSEKLYIGARFRDTGFTNSKVDDFKLFDRQLSSLEMRQNFASNTNSSDTELYEYYLLNHSEKYQHAFTELSKARKDYNVYYQTRFHMMVMEEMPQRRPTYVLKRGLYSTPDLERLVEPGPPEKIFPFGKEYSRDRLGFAQWLTHPNHPLTARVTVNRYWQMVFGRGLVSTSNDFGSQGEFPTHPELLDYLSRDFVDNAWDLKALLKQMVMSHTFRQSSKASAELLANDPENKLLARGPVNHMTSEMLRDNTLYTADLIVDEFGGQSIQAKHLWRNKYRRSVYTYWKRNDPNPEMLIFGTPRRQICSVKREKTSTPLQPLVLMNSPLVTESAKSAAVLTLKEDGNDDTRLNNLYTKLISKPLNDQQLELLKSLLNQQRDYFKQNKSLADQYLKIGKSKIDISKLDQTELASWAVLANTIINLDSFYMVR